jgi:hypothetical protein
VITEPESEFMEPAEGMVNWYLSDERSLSTVPVGDGRRSKHSPREVHGKGDLFSTLRTNPDGDGGGPRALPGGVPWAVSPAAQV